MLQASLKGEARWQPGEAVCPPVTLVQMSRLGLPTAQPSQGTEDVTLDVNPVRHSQAARLLSGLKLVGVLLQQQYICIVTLPWQQ